MRCDAALCVVRIAYIGAIKQGIAGITASGALDGKSEDEKADILLRSEVFYFNQCVLFLAFLDTHITHQHAFQFDGIFPHGRRCSTVETESISDAI